jgi:hypothetical protein
MEKIEFNRDWEKTKNIFFNVYDIEWLCENENKKHSHLSFKVDRQSFDRFFDSKWDSIFDTEKVHNYLSDCISYNGWIINDYKYKLIK